MVGFVESIAVAKTFGMRRGCVCRAASARTRGVRSSDANVAPLGLFQFGCRGDTVRGMSFLLVARGRRARARALFEHMRVRARLTKYSM